VRVFVALGIRRFDSFAITRFKNLAFSVIGYATELRRLLIETTKAIFNNRRRVKFVLKDIEFIRRSYILIF
jgi:hypothetical protein